MEASLRLLMVMESQSLAARLGALLEAEAVPVLWSQAASRAQLVEALAEGEGWDALLCAPALGGASIRELLGEMEGGDCLPPALVICPRPSVSDFRELMRPPVCDLLSEQEPERLRPALERELARAREHRRRKEAEQELAFRLSLEKLITDISTRFIDLETSQVDAEIRLALARIGRFTGVDRCYVFRFSEDGRRMSNSHEWCAQGISSQKERLQDLPVDQFPWHTRHLKNDELIYCPDVSALTEEAAGEKEEWMAEGIQSLLVVPMRMEGRVTGFVGFDAVRSRLNWPRETSFFLRLVAESFAGALERRHDVEVRRKNEEMYHSILDNSDAIIYLKDLQGRYLFINATFERLFHVKRGLFRGKTDRDLFPEEDAAAYSANDQQVLRTRQSIEFEENALIGGVLRTYLSLKFPLYDQSGRLYGVCGISTDITERKRQEELVMNIARGVSAKTGETFFRSLVLHLAETLGARYAFVGELLPGGAGRVRSIAACADGAVAENFEYDLAETPCENVMFQGVCSYPTNVRQIFPRDHLLVQMGVNGYVGAPLCDSSDNPLGILVVLYREEVQNPELVGSLLQIFAARASAELERRKAEAELRRNEERFRRYFELGLVGMAITGPDKRWREVNNRLCTMLGYSREELLRTRWDRLTHPEDLNRNLDHYNDVLLGRSDAYRMEKRFIRKDGSLVYASVSTRCIRNDLGDIDYFITLVQDISERKRAEAALHLALAEAEESREKTDAILRSVMDGLLFTDLEGRVILCNTPAEQFLGLARKQILQRPLCEILPCPQALSLIEEIGEGRSRHAPVEWTLPGTSAEPDRTLELRSCLVHSPGSKKLGVVTLLHDVSRERQMDRMKSEFISTAAHELRTPLTAIMGYSELLLDPESALSEESRRNFLEIIYEKARVLEGITDELLDLSRLQSGKKIRIQPTACHLHELLEQLVEQYRGIAPAHRFELSGCDNRVILADTVKIGQVLENLLSNAVKFSPSGGKVEVRCDRQGQELCVSVQDEGIGMTTAQMEKIFDKFYRADASNTAPSGLGLGMSIARSIVEVHGGRIWVNSTPGRGTRVSFSLPLAPDGEDPRQASETDGQ